MHVLIAYDAPAAGAPLDQLDALEQVRHVELGLRALGRTTDRLPLGPSVAAAATALATAPAGLVFNLVESFAGQGRLIHLVPTLLEALGRRYTGASAEATFTTSNKLVAKRMLAAAGLPTPAWRDRRELQEGARVAPGAWIVKSVWEHASVGLDEDSVVTVESTQALCQALRERLPRLGGSGFAERYVDGREFNLSLLADGGRGPRVLPPAEIVFEGYGADKPRVVGYRAKWEPESYEYSHTPRRFDFPSADAPLLDELERLARAAWELFGLAGWARVDFRVDAAGRAWILEVNTNPCLSPDAGFAAALERAELSGQQALERILADVEPAPGEP